MLLTGHVPFAETHPVRLKVAVKKGIATFPAHMSADAVALIKVCARVSVRVLCLTVVPGIVRY